MDILTETAKAVPFEMAEHSKMTAAEAFARIRRSPQMYKQSTASENVASSNSQTSLHTAIVVTQRVDTHIDQSSISNSSEDGIVSPERSESESSSDISEEIEPHCAVVQGTFALIPACTNSDNLFKGKSRAEQPRQCTLASQRCGEFSSCNTGIILPASARPRHFHLATANARADLLRWLMVPNATICGGQEERSVRFVHNDRFTDDDIIDVLAYAIEEIRNLHTYIESLVDYARRFPYGLTMNGVAREADMEYMNVQPEHFIGAPRRGLEDDVTNAAVEIDYLRECADAVGRRILQAKERAAKMGNKHEAEELLRLGVVNEAWVREKCLML